MRTLWVILMLLMSSAVSVSATPKLMTLYEVRGVGCYSNGVQIPTGSDSIYAIQVMVDITGIDTTWIGLAINGLSLRDPKERARIKAIQAEAVPVQSANREQLKADAVMRAIQARNAAVLMDEATPLRLIDRIKMEVERSPLFVDSTEVVDNQTLKLYVRNEDPDYIFLRRGQAPPRKSQLLYGAAESIATKLERGVPLFLRKGGAICIPMELVSLDKEAVRQLAHPNVTLQELQWKGERE